MYIVHLYPSDIPELAQYAHLLATLSDEHVELAENRKTFQQMCMAESPDIVHVHGCNHSENVKAALWAREKGARIVLTPHGQLESWEMNNRSGQTSGLRDLVAHAYCLIARSPIEAQELKQLGWNTRIETVRNPILTRTISNEELLRQHRRIYQQVMDSYVLEKMDDTTLRALQILIKVGITGDDRWGEPIEPETVNWHLLSIYARQEGIFPIIEKGSLVMGVKIPEEPAVASYLPDHYAPPSSLAGNHLTDIVAAIYHQVQKGTLSLLPLVELDQAMRCDDVEDDMIMQHMESERLTTFFASLMTVMSEQTGLDEGFMPCEPTDNRETNKIRTAIKKHLQI